MVVLDHRHVTSILIHALAGDSVLESGRQDFLVPGVDVKFLSERAADHAVTCQLALTPGSTSGAPCRKRWGNPSWDIDDRPLSVDAMRHNSGRSLRCLCRRHFENDGFLGIFKLILVILVVGIVDLVFVLAAIIPTD